ncbi:MAG: hypothetical protein V3T17_09855 [Pseudomonadales bacterium]
MDRDRGGYVVKLVFILLCLLPTHYTSADGSIPQWQKDLLREYYAHAILKTTKIDVKLSSKISAVRWQFQRYAKTHARPYPELADIPLIQIFNTGSLTLADVITYICLSSGYEPIIHADVELNQPIALNNQLNSLSDMSDYLSDVSNTHVSVYREGKTLLLIPKQDYELAHND